MIKKFVLPIVIFVLLILSGIVSAQDLPEHVPPQYEDAPDCLMESPEGTVGWEDANVFNCTDLGTYEDIRYNLPEGQTHDIQVVEDNLYSQTQVNKNGKSDLIWGCGWHAAHRTNEQSQITTVEGAIYQAWLCYWMFSGGEFPNITEYEIRADGSVGIIDDDDTDDGDDDDGEIMCQYSYYAHFTIVSPGYLDHVTVYCAQGLRIEIDMWGNRGETINYVMDSSPAQEVRFNPSGINIVRAEVRIYLSTGAFDTWTWNQ